MLSCNLMDNFGANIFEDPKNVSWEVVTCEVCTAYDDDCTPNEHLVIVLDLALTFLWNSQTQKDLAMRELNHMLLWNFYNSV